MNACDPLVDGPRRRQTIGERSNRYRQALNLRQRRLRFAPGFGTKTQIRLRYARAEFKDKCGDQRGARNMCS